jgi:hypothetical protein
MEKPDPLEMGRSVLVMPLGELPKKVRIVNRIGNYAILENGIKFHILDDREGRESPQWYCTQSKSVITPIDVLR